MSIRKDETIAEVQIYAEIIPWQQDPCISTSLPSLMSASIGKINTTQFREEHMVDVRQLREGKVALLGLVAFVPLLLWVCSGSGESPVVHSTVEVHNAVEE